MLEDMKIRNLALNTQESYLRQVSQFARHFSKSPDLLGQEEIRSYRIYLTQEKKLAPGSVTIAVSALRFLVGQCRERTRPAAGARFRWISDSESRNHRLRRTVFPWDAMAAQPAAAFVLRSVQGRW